MAEHTERPSTEQPSRKPLAMWQKAALAVALIVTLGGLGMWAYARATEPDEVTIARKRETLQREVATLASSVSDANTPAASSSPLKNLTMGFGGDSTASSTATDSKTLEDAARRFVDETIFGGTPPATTGDTTTTAAGDGGFSQAGRWIDEWSPTVFRLGASFAVGFAFAFAVRSFVKIALIVAGIQILVLMGLESADILTIHWDQLDDTWTQTGTFLSEQFDSMKAFIQGAVPSTAAVIGGMVVGFKR